MKRDDPRRLKETRSFAPVTVPVATPGWADLELFADLSAAEFSALATAMTPCRFEAGDVIMRQGDPGDDLFLLESGAVHVEVGAEDCPRFETTIHAPAALGEMALVTDEPRSATVRAQEASRCLRLERGAFEALLGQRPEVARVLTRMVGERLREIDGIRTVGKYRVTGVIGSGAVARVFSAIHPDLDLPVALKMLSHAVIHHPHFAAAFDDEARVVAGLKHPNVLRVYDTEHAYGTRFIVMERLEGQTLEELLMGSRRLPWPLITRVLVEVAVALHYVHESGLVHRDVKPDNIFLTDSGPAKLIDFGIAIRIDRSECGSKNRLGTPFYMPPEQILGQALDGRSDLYALAMTAYELVTGEVPFDGADLKGLLRGHLYSPLPDVRLRAPEAPAALVDFIRIAGAKDPDDRFPDCQAAADFLAEAAQPDAEGRRLRFPPEHWEAVEAALAKMVRRLARRGIIVEWE